MSEMVERVAMAIWNSRESRFPDRVQRQPDDLDRSSGVWGAVVADARAAIEAMREPTENMLFVGSNEEAGFTAGNLHESWRLMIDEALKD